MLARGDLHRAALCGGGGWKNLAEGDIAGALRAARTDEGQGAKLLEAESLFAAGAIVAGIERLQALHRRGNPAATLALARRRHLLGDHAGAVGAAQALPLNVHAALTGARAALAANQVSMAAKFLDPLLSGAAPIPEPAAAGAVGVVAATVLARRKDTNRLRDFATRLLDTAGMAEEMLPAVARTAWTAGQGAQAWAKFKDTSNPWMAAARLELAVLAGNLALVEQLMRRAGHLGAPSLLAVAMLRGDGPEAKAPGTEVATRAFREGAVVHVWRTHRNRWQPWIDAAQDTPADVQIHNLATDTLPDRETIPSAVLDDSALVELFEPKPPQKRNRRGKGLWVDGSLCQGVGIGHDWPEEETAEAYKSMRPANSLTGAAVAVLGAEAAMERAREGWPTVVLAPPGDPFWAGPLPERAWPNLRVVRAEAEAGWHGAGTRVAETATALLADKLQEN